jgi:hypothetical protein
LHKSSNNPSKTGTNPDNSETPIGYFAPVEIKAGWFSGDEERGERVVEVCVWVGAEGDSQRWKLENSDDF